MHSKGFLSAIIVTAAGLILPTTSSATTINFTTATGTINVTTTSGDAVTLAVVGGCVEINSQQPIIDGGSAGCVAPGLLNAINITGDNAANFVDLQLYTTANGFPASRTTTINTLGGDDMILTSNSWDFITPGPGNDTINSGWGNEAASTFGNSDFISIYPTQSGTKSITSNAASVYFGGSLASDPISATISASGAAITLSSSISALGVSSSTVLNNGARSLAIELGSSSDSFTASTSMSGTAATLSTFSIQGGPGSDSINIASIQRAADILVYENADGADTITGA
ncbi:MAG: hypothetical protein ABI579_00060, partial [Candidatus Sumerlaeota bacterium]